ncbi:zinc-binding alcohol dehydrogenase family protein [Plastoroseomonas arctica]|uniref:Zinc-type alcohol dehydrogenase-like protein n=1 Tax=Plastoroseomonas arctica TaxID=1509237 RepID=A0AAF1K506_9PROT|nr:zinc-binding alcohol dehydrogenase family protein [Plastoroseomonas arctica]MBR0655895.1 zinc-binding alcohol dehydrogenase family protein [Plastoroseomonas arctica]
MKAVAYTESLPIENDRSLFDTELPNPEPGPRDLLVRIKAISVNPVDTKVRMRRQGSAEAPVVLGWDAAGIVEAVGAEVTLFRAGDAVYYAGDIGRPGSNAEYGLVDERIAGAKPTSLSFAEAAALPLTAITAWESLFERLRLPVGKARSDDAILIIGAAGGVGSIAVQLARRLTGLTVIGTASRPDSVRWVEQAGAHAVIDHTRPLSEELARIGHPTVRNILSLTATATHWDEITKALAPQGQVCLIDDPGALDIGKLKQKSGALHWEFMFTRSMFATPDMIQQHHLLNEVAALVDAGLIRTTLGQNFGAINAANLRRAHAALESGRSIGKAVLEAG